MKTQFNTSKLLAAVAAWALGALGTGMSATILLDRPITDTLTPTQLYYSFDSLATPTTVADGSGNGNTGTLYEGTHNKPPTLVDGKFDKAVYFDGEGTAITDVQPYLYANNSSSLQLAGESFTAGAWLNFSSIQEGSYNTIIFSKGSQGVASDGGFTFLLGKSSTPGKWGLYFETRNSTSNSTDTVTTGSLELNLQTDTWYHFAMSFDADQNQVIFYMDGTALGSPVSPTVAMDDKTTNLYMNERGTSTWSGWFDGAYDDAFITEGVHTFAIPEPSTLLMILPVMGCLLFRRRKRE